MTNEKRIRIKKEFIENCQILKILVEKALEIICEDMVPVYKSLKFRYEIDKTEILNRSKMSIDRLKAFDMWPPPDHILVKYEMGLLDG